MLCFIAFYIVRRGMGKVNERIEFEEDEEHEDILFQL
jgi:hypothetical protein